MPKTTVLSGGTHLSYGKVGVLFFRKTHLKKGGIMLKRDDKDFRNDDIIAFLGKGTEFKGVMTYEGTVRVDGKIEGEILTKGTLVVGDTAVLNAEINAGTIICSGKINGNLVAKEKVQLLSPAVLTGSIKSPILLIEEGVRFNGTCDMGKEKEEIPSFGSPSNNSKVKEEVKVG